jgi:DNA modification methylase
MQMEAILPERKNRRTTPPPLIWSTRSVEERSISSLEPYVTNNRHHTDKSIARLKNSVAKFGFVAPMVIDRDGVIVCGHGRYFAAKALGLQTVPCVVVDHLSNAEVRALRIADNKLAELSCWNEDALRFEFRDLCDLDLAGALDFDLQVTGFETAEIDLVLAGDVEEEAEDDAETIGEPAPGQLAVTKAGDLWGAGGHRVLCGDALDRVSYATVLGDEAPSMVVTDPPYNVAVQGHVRTGTDNRHREFAMASGEMSGDEFVTFLKTFIACAIASLPEGGIVMIFMDWRHIDQLILAGKASGLELINLCVWNKTNGGMGSLYRSKHELVCVFKKPGAAHVNNVELGRYGRYRTNVWDYAGVNSFGPSRTADLADHPTVKPTALVADAIMDVSHRGDIVLDPFGGSGATLLAAEKTGRRARLIELDPLYVDVAIRRWQALTGKAAVHLATGETFDARASSVEASKPGEGGQ